MQITEQCLQLAIWNTTQERIKKCDVSILIDHQYKLSMFSINKAQELYDIGYKSTIDKMNLILKSIG